MSGFTLAYFKRTYFSIRFVALKLMYSLRPAKAYKTVVFRYFR